MSDIEQIIQDEIDDLIPKELPMAEELRKLRLEAGDLDRERAKIARRKQQLQLTLMRLDGNDRADLGDANIELAKRETHVRKEADQ